MRKRWRSYGCLLVVLFPLICCGLLMLLATEDVGYCDGDIDRTSIDVVAEAFVWTLLDNCIDVTKRIVAEGQWNRLDKWETEHDMADCSALSRFFNSTDEWSYQVIAPVINEPDGTVRDDPLFFGESGDVYPVDTIAKVEFYSVWWPCSGGDYVDVDNLTFRWTEVGWQVEDWGEISSLFLAINSSSSTR